MPESSKVICVGTPAGLIMSRRLVLESAGYETTCLPVPEALQLLGERTFGVLMISVTVGEEDRAALRSAASTGTRIIQLNQFTDPHELLTLLAT